MRTPLEVLEIAKALDAMMIRDGIGKEERMKFLSCLDHLYETVPPHNIREGQIVSWGPVLDPPWPPCEQAE